MKKVIALLLVMALSVSVFTACGKTADPTEVKTESTSAGEKPDDGTITLNVALWDYEVEPGWKAMFDTYMELHPNVHLEVIDIPSTDYNTKLNVMLNGGSDLDVYLAKDAGTLCDFEAKGQCEPLDEYIVADGIDTSVYNGIAESMKLNDKQCALPVNTSFYVLYYNKDLFDAANKPYPSGDMTWEEFEQLALEMTSGSGENKVYGAMFHSWPSLVTNWAVQDGKHTTMDYQTGYDFFKPYYEMVLRLQDAGAIQDFGELKSANIHYSGAFAAGNVAMMPMGIWFASTMASKMKNNEANMNAWGIATIPHPSTVEAGYTVGASTPACINAASKQKDAAWDFLKFITGEEGQKVYAEAGGISAIQNDETRALIASAEGMPDNMAEALKVKNIVPDGPIAPNITELSDMIAQEHTMIMLGESTVDEGLKSMSERAAEILG